MEPRQANLNKGLKEKNRDNFGSTIQENSRIKYHTKKALYIGELPLFKNYIPQIQVDRSSESHNESQNSENLNSTSPLFGELPLIENYTPQFQVDRSSERQDESQNDENLTPTSPLFNSSSQQQNLREKKNGNSFRKRPRVIPPRARNNDLNLPLNQRSEQHPFPRHLHNSRGSANIPQNQRNRNFFRKRPYPIPPPPPPTTRSSAKSAQSTRLASTTSNNARGTSTPWYRYSVQHKSPDWTKHLEMIRLITSSQ